MLCVGKLPMDQSGDKERQTPIVDRNGLEPFTKVYFLDLFLLGYNQ